jgi:hypothetical protein
VGFTERSIEVSTESPESEAAQTRSRAKQTKAEPSQQDAPESPDMPVSQLIEGSTGYLGYPSWAAAGALSDHEPDEMMSVDTAKSLVEKWHETPLDDADAGEE